MCLHHSRFSNTMENATAPAATAAAAAVAASTLVRHCTEGICVQHVSFQELLDGVTGHPPSPLPIGIYVQ
jgi:hypothetical protein